MTTLPQRSVQEDNAASRTEIARATRPARVLAVVRQAGREHGLWAVVTGTHLLIGVLLTQLGGVRIVRPGFTDDSLRYWVYLLGLTLYWPIPLLIWRRLQVRDTHGRRMSGLAGWRLAVRHWRRDVAPDRLLGVVLASGLIVVTLFTHDAWKSTIGILEPVSWDRTLSELDRTLHGGRYPWEWLQPWLGTPLRTHWVDVSYSLWYWLYTGMLIWQCWNPNRRERARFFLSFALAWVALGTILGHALASGGPVFYGGLVNGPDPYRDLRTYLWGTHQVIPLRAVVLETAVWNSYATGARSFWIAMSAMPSLHVAMAALFALGTWATSRPISLAFWAYTLLTMVGSIHLGWHYGVDGYVALIGMVGIWWATAYLTRGVRDEVA